MTGYQRILNQMRKQAKRTAESGVSIGVMGDDLTCEIGELVIDREDYLIANHLLTGYTDKDGNPVRGVQKGDTVVVKKVSDELYLIIERVV